MKFNIHSLGRTATAFKSDVAICPSCKKNSSDRHFISHRVSSSSINKIPAISVRIASLSATIATTAALVLFSSPATAFTITPNRSTSDLLEALLGDTTGLSNFAIDTTGNADAFGLFENDPFGLGSGIVLSTGNAMDLPGQNDKDGGLIPDYDNFPNDISTDFGEEGADDDFISLEISFDADTTVQKLFFEYAFGSEEFLEFGGSEFNDLFELRLNGINLAYLTDGQPVAINNLVPDPMDGVYHPDYINNPSDRATVTKLDGFTQMLTFEGLLVPNGRNTLTIAIRDVEDGLLDSAVFLKGGSLGTQQPSETEKVPEPSLAIALLALSGMTLLKGLKRR